MEKIVIKPIVKVQPSARTGASMVVDTHEKIIPQVQKYFNDHFGQIPISTETLDVGDFLFKWNDKDLIVIERKTIPDLMSSIKSDGRYREQKKRLKAATQLDPGLRVYYLIEGQLGSRPTDRYFTEKDRKTAYSASVNTLVRDGIPVMRTESLTDTLRTLGKIWECINKEGDKLVHLDLPAAGDIGPVPQGQLGYMVPIKTRRGENYSEEWCFLAQLQQIPGVSEDVAEAIGEKYPNLPSLMSAYQALSDVKQCLLLFVDMPLPKRKRTSTGKVRTIGPSLSEKIWKYLGSPAPAAVLAPVP